MALLFVAVIMAAYSSAQSQCELGDRSGVFKQGVWLGGNGGRPANSNKAISAVTAWSGTSGRNYTTVLSDPECFISQNGYDGLWGMSIKDKTFVTLLSNTGSGDIGCTSLGDYSLVLWSYAKPNTPPRRVRSCHYAKGTAEWDTLTACGATVGVPGGVSFADDGAFFCSNGQDLYSFLPDCSVRSIGYLPYRTSQAYRVAVNKENNTMYYAYAPALMEVHYTLTNITTKVYPTGLLPLNNVHGSIFLIYDPVGETFFAQLSGFGETNDMWRWSVARSRLLPVATWTGLQFNIYTTGIDTRYYNNFQPPQPVRLSPGYAQTWAFPHQWGCAVPELSPVTTTGWVNQQQEYDGSIVWD